MKKTVCILLVLFLCGLCIFANTDSFAYMFANKSFTQVMDAINQNATYETVHSLFVKSLNEVADDIALVLKVKLSYYDYINELDGKKYKNELKNGLKDCYNDFEKLEKSNTIEVIKDVLEFLLYGIDYRITGSLVKGTKALQCIDSLYKKYSNDETVMLLYARRKSQAPKIGGGDSDVALKVLTELLENIKNKALSFQFEVFSELELIYQKTDKEKASYYSEKAKTLY